MYTIKHAAELVGVSVSTLRAWERRYGVGAGERTESGYRLYDERAVETLRTMNALVGEGWSVRAAAEEMQRRATPTPAGPTGIDPTPRAARVEGEDALVRAAAEFDVAALTGVLDHRFGSASFEAVVDGWLLPELVDVGLGWETGRVTVAGEHLVAAGVQRRLSAAYDAAGASRLERRVIVGLPPGCRHELGLLAFATAARRAGLATTWLGADVPVVDWVAAVTASAPVAVVLAAPMEADLEPLARTVAAIGDDRPDLLIGVGGSAQDRAPQRCLRLGHQVGPAARLLAERLALPRSTDRG